MNSLTISIDRVELDYIESVINVTFRPTKFADALVEVVIVSNGDLDPFDGYANYVYQNSTLKPISATIEIESSFANQSYLFLHELGHVLGLHEHRNGVPSDTLMFENGGGYSRSYLDTINEYGSMDIIDLWGIWGVSDEWYGEVRGDARDNRIYGGCGVVDAHDNNDEIYGGLGNDTLFGNAGNDTIIGGVALVDTNDGDDIIYAGFGDDYVASNAGDDIVYGGPGNDTIYGGLGSDTLYGGDGADIFYVDSTDVVVDFEQLIDTVVYYD